jgi:hypothetical protein
VDLHLRDAPDVSREDPLAEPGAKRSICASIRSVTSLL